MTALKKQKPNKIDGPHLKIEVWFFVCKNQTKVDIFYRILIEIYKRTLFSERKFAIILTKEAVTETVKLRYKYGKESNEC